MRASWGLLVSMLVAGVVLLPASAANAATLTACVKKKTGEMRLRQGKAAKKKCPKGWRKVRWNTVGPAGRNGTNGTNGTAGPPGPVINLHDAGGAVVGQFLATFSEGGLRFLVLRDAGVWEYLGSGELNPYTGGAARAWKSSGTTQPVTTTQLYRRDNAGTCGTDGGPFTGDLVAMDEVAAPPDFVGPLTIG